MSDKIILYGDCYDGVAGITNFDVVQTSGNDFDFIADLGTGMAIVSTAPLENMAFLMRDKTPDGYVVYTRDVGGGSSKSPIRTEAQSIRNYVNACGAASVYGNYLEEFCNAMKQSLDIHDYYHVGFGPYGRRMGNGQTLVDIAANNKAKVYWGAWPGKVLWTPIGETSTINYMNLDFMLALLNIKSDVNSNKIKVSDALKKLINDTVNAAITNDRSVDWTVNIDGVKNPTISITWSNDLAAQAEQSSVEMRAFASSAYNIGSLSIDDTFYKGRYDLNAQPIVFSWQKIYTEYGSGTNWYDEYTKFLQNYIVKPFTGTGALILLLFRMSFISDGKMLNSSWCYVEIDYFGKAVSYGIWQTEINDGSTVTVTNKDTDDVLQEFTDEYDNIDTSNYAVSGLSIFTKTQVMSVARLKQLGIYLWSKTFVDDIFNVNQDPISNIVSLKVFPFTIEGGADAPVYLGNVNTGIMANPVGENTNFVIDVGTFKIEKKYNNWLDYSLTAINIFLPMCGFFPLDTNIYMDKTINVKYYIDIITGVCKAVIYANNIPCQEFGGQIGFDISISASTRAQNELTQINAALGGVGSIASKDLGGLFSSAQSVLFRPNDNIRSVGSSSPTCNMMTTHDCFLVIQRPVVQYPSNYGHVFGYPCNLKCTLNNLHGFTKCKNVDLSGVPCTEEEKDLLKRYLEDGIII